MTSKIILDPIYRAAIQACIEIKMPLKIQEAHDLFFALLESEKERDDLNGQLEASFNLLNGHKEEVYKLQKEIKRLQEYEYMYKSLEK